MSTVFSAEDLPMLEGSQGDLPKPGGSDGAAGGAGGDKPAEPPAPAEFRFGDDAPEEWRGKTQAEAAAIYTSVREIGRNAMQGLQELQRRPAPAAPAPAAEADYRITDDDLTASNAATVNEKLDRLFMAKAGPLVNQIWQGLGGIAYMVAKSDRTMPYFEKYEQEILHLASQQRADFMANPMAWQKLYKQVIGTHQDEIIEAEVRKRIKGEAPSEEPKGDSRRAVPFSESGGRGAPSGEAEPAATPEQIAAARALGVDPNDKSFLALAKSMRG